MAEVVRGETSIGPVAIDGRTITFVARTSGVRFGHDTRAGALHVRARPAHVEILDETGRHHVVRIHDVERLLLAGIAAGALACVVAARALRAGGTRKASR